MHMKGPPVAAIRSPLMEALDGIVETLGLWNLIFLDKVPFFQILPNHVLCKVFLDNCSREITISWCSCSKSGTPVICRDKNLAIHRKEYLRTGELVSAKGIFFSNRWAKSINYDLIELEIYESNWKACEICQPFQRMFSLAIHLKPSTNACALKLWQRFATSHETAPCFN